MTLSPAIRQLSIVFATMFATFSAGAGMGSPSILLYQLRRNDTEIPLHLNTASWIGSIQGLAGLPAIIAPILMQWKGRKFTFLTACLFVLTGWAIAYAANDITMILASESLHGFGANVLLTVSYDCLSEMITPIYRNVSVQLYIITNVFGVAMPGVLTMFVHWRTLCMIMCVPAVLGILISLSWLESPLWLAYKQDYGKCKNNFTKIRGTDDFSMKELQEVMAAQRETLSRKKTLTADNILKHHWRQITNRDFIKPALHILILLNHSYWSGFTVVLLYSIELISKATDNERAALIGAIIINLVLVLGAAISSIVIRFYNNKPVILCSTAGTTTLILSVSVVSYLQSVGVLDQKSLLMLYLLVGYMMTSSLGQSSVVFAMSAELMPVKHRGIGGALLVIYACVLHATSLKIGPYLFVFIDIWGTFLIYACNSIICGVLIWKYVPETRGKTLSEIENYYTNGTFEIKLLPAEAGLLDK